VGKICASDFKGSSSVSEFRRCTVAISVFARESPSLLKHLYEAWVVTPKVLKAEDL
jgi:hypothetical protein